MTSRRSWVWALASAAVAGLFALPVFVRMTSLEVKSDILTHAELAGEVVASGNWISYSLWYPLIYVASGGLASDFAIRLASVVLLSGFVAALALVTFVIARRYVETDRLAALIALAVVVVTPLVNPQDPTGVYLGQFSATVWHNSTNITAAPFVLLAFVAGIALLDRLTVRSAVLFSLAIVGSVLAKPNFALALLPVLGIALLIALWRAKTPWPRRLALIAISFVPVTLLLLVQYAAVYGDAGLRQAPIVVAPFAVWTMLSSNLVLSLLLSLAGPLAALTLIPAAPALSRTLVIAWCAFGVAAAQAIVLAEEALPGFIARSGNWFWGAHSALIPVFLFSIIAVIHTLPRARRSSDIAVWSFVAGTLLLAHVLSGVYYALSIGTADWSY